MRRVLVLVFCFVSALFAWANDGAFYAEGTHLIPISETDISVKKEVLTLNRVGEKIQVTVYYEFYNPAAEKEVLVGFEAAPPDVYFNLESVRQFPQHPYMRNFKVVMNGEPLSYEVAHVAKYDKDWNYISDPQYYVDGEIKSAAPEELFIEKWLAEADDEPQDHPLYVYHFKAQFRPGLNIIQHTYDFDMSIERNGFTQEFFYILTAANRWANHQIDDFTLYVDMGDHTSFHISPRFFKSADEWEIKGAGKYTIGTIAEQVRPDSIFFHMQHGSIRFHKENFHPDGELSITIDNPWGLWTIWGLNRDDAYDTEFVFNSYKEQYQFFIGPSYSGSYIDADKKDFYNDLFTAEQRRILRNLPFAYRGYVFKTRELQDYFESTAWYLPDPDYKALMEELPDEEKKWVQYWTTSDSIDIAKRKAVEERVNSIYQHVIPAYLKAKTPPLRYDFDALYFSKDFFNLHDRISAIENRLHEPIIHDVDYWIHGQDWCDDLSARVLGVELVSGRKARVRINIHNCNDHKMTLVMVYERNNWFIDDMINGSSLRRAILDELKVRR